VYSCSLSYLGTEPFAYSSGDQISFFTPPAELGSRQCYRYLHSFNKPMLFIYWHIIQTCLIPKPRDAFHRYLRRYFEFEKSGNHLETPNWSKSRYNLRPQVHETKFVPHVAMATPPHSAGPHDLLHFVPLHSVSHYRASFLRVQSKWSSPVSLLISIFPVNML